MKNFINREYTIPLFVSSIKRRNYNILKDFIENKEYRNVILQMREKNKKKIVKWLIRNNHIDVFNMIINLYEKEMYDNSNSKVAKVYSDYIKLLLKCIIQRQSQYHKIFLTELIKNDNLSYSHYTYLIYKSIYFDNYNVIEFLLNSEIINKSKIYIDIYYALDTLMNWLIVNSYNIEAIKLYDIYYKIESSQTIDLTCCLYPNKFHNQSHIYRLLIDTIKYNNIILFNHIIHNMKETLNIDINRFYKINILKQCGILGRLDMIKIYMEIFKDILDRNIDNNIVYNTCNAFIEAIHYNHFDVIEYLMNIYTEDDINELNKGYNTRIFHNIIQHSIHCMDNVLINKKTNIEIIKYLVSKGIKFTNYENKGNWMITNTLINYDEDKELQKYFLQELKYPFKISHIKQMNLIEVYKKGIEKLLDKYLNKNIIKNIFDIFEKRIEKI